MRIAQWMHTKVTRALCFALFLFLIPVSSRAGVFISVGIAPPPLPVVVIDDQPPCPEPGWIWTPGYWAYGDDGYYWVPGTWVPAPQPGFLWTPGYWGWNAGLYMWHPGYWGPHVGYYGGVNYGFGYFGVGFVGGMWRGHDFVYNTAVVNVNRTVIHNVYEDRHDFRDHEVDRDRDRHISFSGGPGGIRHDPDRDERRAMDEHHWGASQVQSQHEFAARGDHSNYFNNNHGAPSHTFVPRPMEGPRGGNPQFQQRGDQNIHQAPNGGPFNNGQQRGQNQPDQHNWQQPQQHNWNQPQQPQQQHNWNDQQQHNSQQPQQPQRQWQPQPEQRQWQQPQQPQQPQTQRHDWNQQHDPQPSQHQGQQLPPPQQPQWQQQHQQPQQPQRQWQQPQQQHQPPPQPQQHNWNPPQPHNNPPPPPPHNNPPPQQHGGGGNDHDHGHH